MNKNTRNTFSQNKIYTLAQNETTNYVQANSIPVIMVSGNGTKLTEKTMESRAKRKMITQKTILALIDVAKEKGAKDREKAYWNTYHCQNHVITSGGVLYGQYCKNRFCTVCSGIRKAELINKYLPVISTWKEPYFVTLIVKSIPADKLRVMMKAVLRGFAKIKDKYRKKSQRGKADRWIGIKSLECNFNPKRKTYNPHLHLIVPNKLMADTLVNEWLTIWTDKFTGRKAQHSRKVKEKEKDLVEVIKYGSKIFTEPDPNGKNKKKVSHEIYASALDNIYASMKGLRIFGRFGFNLPKEVKPAKPGAKILTDFIKWEFDLQSGNWLAPEQDSTLSNFSPSPALFEILEFNINTELE